MLSQAQQTQTPRPDASQLGFTALQTRANELAEAGQLVEARPLLKELVKRVEASDESEIKLDFPLFLIGTGYIQEYVATGEKNLLKETLKWYDRLESDYPDSSRIKDALLKRIDVLRVLARNDDAITLMKNLIAGDYSTVRLSFPERTKLLRDLTQIHYNTGKLEEGLPYFGELLEVSRDTEEQALAAAASFEALFQVKRMDDALRLLPMLAGESEVRYRPRLNVALLKASDALVDAGRVNDAALTLNIIKTTDMMVQFHEDQIALKSAQLEQREAFGQASENIDRLRQEISTLEANLEHLRDLPTLRNELLVRRARNYTNTGRRYEAFWMFHDLMMENPEDDRSEYYHYATFSNALQIDKPETAIEVGKIYRRKFPNGEYYSDVSGALAVELKKTGDEEGFLELAVDFLDSRPRDVVSKSLFAQWASFLLEKERYDELLRQTKIWMQQTQNPIFEDGAFYWSGMAHLLQDSYQNAVVEFDKVIEKFPPGMFGMMQSSPYTEDALLRKGIASFYEQDYETALTTLLQYKETYPKGNSIDQAFYFLGEIENMAGNYAQALEYFEKANQITQSQDIHDSVAFSVGAILEELGRYEAMAEHFQTYINRFGVEGNLTRAVLQLGIAFEYLMRPVEMLALYRENIERFAQDPNNSGVDALIESYAEKYQENFTMLERTVKFFDRLEEDAPFREKIVTDRGFLFEHFYENSDLDQSLYNRLRRHPEFTEALIEDLGPIQELITPYRTQLAEFPEETPEAYFRDQLAQARGEEDIVAETRMLMGLYRLGIELDPSRTFDSELVERLTPRTILYVADYERNKRLPFAVEAWNSLLLNYPQDDATIVAYMRLADVSEEKEQLSDALNYLDQIVEQFPGSPKAPAVILRQGELLAQMGREQEAREKYQYMLRVPDWRGVLHARALYQTGESYMAENAYAEAHGFFERTFLGYPHLTEWSARAYLADAEALLAMGSREDAVTTLQEAVEELTSAPETIMQAIEAKLKELQP